MSRQQAKDNQALWQASFSGKIKEVRTLLAKGAETEGYKPDNGATALMVACKNSHLEVAEELIKAGADVKVKDKANNDALTVCKQNSFMKGIKLLNKALKGEIEIARPAAEPTEDPHAGKGKGFLRGHYSKEFGTSKQIQKNVEGELKLHCEVCRKNLAPAEAVIAKDKSVFCKPCDDGIKNAEAKKHEKARGQATMQSKPKFCSNCGTKGNGGKFCSNCGSKM